LLQGAGHAGKSRTPMNMGFLHGLRLEANTGIFMPEAAQRSMKISHCQLKQTVMIFSLFISFRFIERTIFIGMTKYAF